MARRKYLQDPHLFQTTSLLWLHYSSATLTFAGVTHLVGFIILQSEILKLVSYIALIIGFGIAGYTIASHNALLRNQVIKIDFYRSLIEITLVILFSWAIFYGFHYLLAYHLTPITFPLVIYVAITLQFVAPWGRNRINGYLMPPLQAESYAEISNIVNEAFVHQPSTPMGLVSLQEKLNDAIEDARLEEQKELRQTIASECERVFRNKTFDKDILGEGKLLQLVIMQQSLDSFKEANQLTTLSTAQKADVLRKVLTDYIEAKLNPNPGQLPPSVLTAEWIAYLILYYKCIDKMTRQEIERKFQALGSDKVIKSNTYTIHFQQGRDLLAASLFEAEMQARYGNEP